MPTLPIVPVTIPSVLAGQSNGRLPDSILWDTPGQAGGAIVRLVEPAARSWRALSGTALPFGHILKPTSLFDSYRPFEVQDRIFRQRYTTEILPDRPRRFCMGKYWYLRPNNAPAACPGTSNHGWALAVDVGEERDGDTGTESIDTDTLNWLIANALRFGFSGELQVEPWHWRYFPGDDIPDAVLAYEEDDMPTAEEIATAVWTRDIESDVAVEPAWKVLDKAGEDAAAAVTGVNQVKAEQVRTNERLAAIEAALGQTPPPGEVTVSAASQTAIANETADVVAGRLND